MSLTVNAQVEPQTITVGKKTYTVTFNSRTLRFETKYGSDRIAGDTMARIITAIESRNWDAQQKRDRAKSLKAAEAEPIPAMMFAGLTNQPTAVGVRGIDQRTNMVLILVGTEKKSVMRAQLYRPLTEEEQAKLIAAANEHYAAVDGASKVEGASRYDVTGEMDGEVTATYDSETDEWIVTYADITVRGDRINNLRQEIEGTLVARLYPWCVDSAEVPIILETGVDHWSGTLYRTREEAQAYIDARLKAVAASLKKSALQAEYQLDLSGLSE